MAETIGDVAVRIGADTSGLTRGLADADSSLKSFGSKAGAVAGNVAALGAAAVAAGAAIGAALAVKGLEAVDALDEMAGKAVASVKSLQSLQLALGEAGINSDQTQAAIKKLTVAIGEAQGGNAKAQQTFDQLGLSVGQLAGMDADQRFAAIADALQGYGNAADRATIASDLFGAKIGPDLAAAMSQGGDAIRQASADIEAMGLALSDIDAAKVANAMDSFGRAQGVIDGVANKLAVELAPVLDAVSQAFIDAGKEGGGFGGMVTKAVEAAIKAVAFLANAVDSVKRLGGVVADSLVYAFALVQETFTKVALGIVKTLDMIPGVDLTANVVALEAKVTQAQGVMREAAAEIKAGFEKPLAGDVFTQYVAQAKKASEEAAAASVAGRQSAAGGEAAPGAGDNKAAEALAKKQAQWDNELNAYVQAEADKAAASDAADRERMAAEIARIQDQYKTEDQLLADKLAREQAAIAAAREAGVISKDQYDAMMLDSYVAHEASLEAVAQKGADARKAIHQLEMNDKLGVAKSALSLLTTLNDSGSRKAFEQNKKFALADAAISMYQGIAAGVKLGYPLAIPAVAAAIATGSAAIANIRKQQFGGGGASAGAGGSAGSAAGGMGGGDGGSRGGNAPTQRTNITLVGDMFGREAVIGLLNEAFKDGYTISGA